MHYESVLHPLRREARELRIGSLPDSYNRNPQRPDLGKFPLNASLFDTLVRMNERFEPEPMLATQWSYDEGTNTYRFHLQPGVRCHDGHEFSAADVKYTFDLVVAGSPHNHQQLGPESVRVVDAHTVDITPQVENRWLVEQLVHPVWGINRDGSDPLRPCGTGPFRFVEYVRDQQLVAERFDDHWATSRTARSTRITFAFTTDSSTRVEGLLAGQYELVVDVPRERSGELEDGPGVRVVRSPVGAYNAIGVNIAGEAPHDLGADRRIRRAVAAAIDRRAVLSQVWRGNAEDSPTWIPPAVLGPYAEMIRGVPFDPAAAARLLDDAGFSTAGDGVRVKGRRRLTLVHVLGSPGDSDPRDSLAAAQLVQSMLGRVGIETVIEIAETGRLADGRYDLYQGVANQNEAYPARLPDIIHYSRGGPGTRFRAPGGATDAAIERARTAANIDEARRHAAEAARLLVDVEHVVIPLANIWRVWAMKDTVGGFVAHPSLTNQRWEGIYMTDG